MLRPLSHYFLIGGLLFGAKALYDGSHVEGPAITVRVPRGANAYETERAVDEAILLNEARRYGWDRTDPIVFTHLVRNMRFIEPDTEDEDLALFKRAIEMNMQAHDPVVRARLLYRARESLAYVPEDRQPSREELEAHRQAHPDRFERDPRVRFQQVFLSRTKRGETLPADGTAMRETLSQLGDAAPEGLGDPLPGLRREQSSTPTKVRREYGQALGEVIETPVIGVWRGPIPSVFGLHFVKVISIEPAYVPSLEVIGAEVRADRLAEIRKELSAERMEVLRSAYRVTIEREK